MTTNSLNEKVRREIFENAIIKTSILGIIIILIELIFWEENIKEFNWLFIVILIDFSVLLYLFIKIYKDYKNKEQWRISQEFVENNLVPECEIEVIPRRGYFKKYKKFLYMELPRIGGKYFAKLSYSGKKISIWIVFNNEECLFLEYVTPKNFLYSYQLAEEIIDEEDVIEEVIDDEEYAVERNKLKSKFKVVQ